MVGQAEAVTARYFHFYDMQYIFFYFFLVFVNYCFYLCDRKFDEG